jgi:hypothetical protein
MMLLLHAQVIAAEKQLLTDSTGAAFKIARLRQVPLAALSQGNLLDRP